MNVNFSNLKIVSAGELKTENRQADNKPNRQYYTVEFGNADNPFLRTRSLNFWQQHINRKNAAGELETVCEWRGADPKTIKTMVGKTVRGAIVEGNVEPYTLNVTKGGVEEERTITTFTTVVFEGELPESVFKRQGHPLASVEPTVVAQQAAEPVVEAAEANPAEANA